MKFYISGQQSADIGPAPIDAMSAWIIAETQQRRQQQKQLIKLMLRVIKYHDSYQLSHVWDKLLHTDDRHRKSVLMKASDVKPKRR